MSACDGSGEIQTGVTVGNGTSTVWVGGATVGGRGVDVGGTAVAFPQDESMTAMARNMNILLVMSTRPYKKVIIREYSMGWENYRINGTVHPSYPAEG
jgi:hypothetical protein